MGGLVPRAQSRSREHEGAKAGRGLPVPGNSQHVCLSQYLDREDLWVRFAILFSVRVINQLHAHSGCSAGLRRAHWRSHTPREAVWTLPDVSREGKELSRALPGSRDPRTTQNQGLKAGRQGVPVIRETAITQVISMSSAACLAGSKSWLTVYQPCALGHVACRAPCLHFPTCEMKLSIVCTAEYGGENKMS